MKTARIVSCLLVLCLALTALVGCNRVDAGRLSEIAGTYELTRYEVTNRYDAKGNSIPEDQRVTKDFLVEAGMRVYLVIPTAGPAYYVYRDSETDWYTLTVLPHYDYETEQDENGASHTTDRIGHISLTGDGGFSVSLYVQSRAKTFTDNKAAWQTSFRGALSGNTYYIGNKADVKITYKRISDKAELSVVEAKAKTTLTPIPYEMIPLFLTKSFTASASGVEDPNIYDYYFFDVPGGTVTRCYADKSETPEKREETLPFTVDPNTNTVTIGDTRFSVTSGSDYELWNDAYSYVIRQNHATESEVREMLDSYIAEYLEYLDSFPAD